MSKVLHRKADEVTSCTSPYSDILTQEVLAQGFCIRVKGRGFSMYPFVRTGDTLLIEPKTPAELNIGDIIFYRRSTGLYVAHRLIKKNDSATLITKGDNLHYYDEPVPAEQVLGRVVSVERDGHYQSLDSWLNKAVSRFWTMLSPISWRLRPILKLGWKLCRRFSPAGLRGQFELVMRKIQGISVYRKVAKQLRNGIEVKEANKEEVQQAFPMSDLNHVKDTLSKDIDAAYFVAKKRDRVIGHVVMVKRSKEYYPHDGYWLTNLMVRTLYRGIGIGEELTQIVIEESIKEGAKRISLLVYEDNQPAIKLYEKLGFERRVIPALEKQLEDELHTFGRRRICMSISLN